MRFKKGWLFGGSGWHCGWLLLAASVSSYGQVSVVRAGSFEVGPFIGASFGGGSSAFSVMGGGNVTYAINKYILPYVEYTYLPFASTTVQGVFSGTQNPYTASYSLAFQDIHGGVHIRFPVREKPVVPYLVFGLGALRRSDTTLTVSSAAGSSGTLTVPSSSNFAFNVGGGLRYYINQRFGIRTEAKVYRLSGNEVLGPTVLGNTFGKVEFGFFFQLH